MLEGVGGPTSVCKEIKSFVIEHESISEGIRKKDLKKQLTTIFEAHEKIDGMYIEYLLEEDQYILKDLRRIFPKKNVRTLVAMMKRISKELKISSSYEILISLAEISDIGGRNQNFSIGNSKKGILYLLNENYKGKTFLDEKILYHEIMHLKEFNERSIPSLDMVTLKFKYPWLTALSHFSTEGRLEKMKLPHLYTKKELIDDLSYIFHINKTLANDIGNELWGKKPDFKKYCEIYEDNLYPEIEKHNKLKKNK
jgi:hypothetical protein